MNWVWACAELSNINNSKYFGQLASISPEVIRNNQDVARVRFEGKQPEGLRQNQRVTARLLIEEKPMLPVARGNFVESEGGRFAHVISEKGQAIHRPVKLGQPV